MAPRCCGLWDAGEGYVGDYGGVCCCCGAGAAGVGESPESSAAFACEEEVDWAGAAAVAGMPAAAAFVASAGPQVGWEQVTTCVSCEVCESGRAGGACGDLSAAVRALAAYEGKPAGVWA